MPRTAQMGTNRRMVEEIIAPGIAGGVFAGLVALLILLVISAVAGRGFLWPLQLIGGTVYREPVPAGAGPIAVGLAIHVVVSAIFGTLFNSIVPRGVPFAWALSAGLLYGLLLFLLATWLVMPLVDPVLFTSVGHGWFLLFHVIFGVLVALTIPLRRSVSAELPRPARRVHT